MVIRATPWKLNLPLKPEEYVYSPDNKYRKDFPSIQEADRVRKLEEETKERQLQEKADLFQGWTKV